MRFTGDRMKSHLFGENCNVTETGLISACLQIITNRKRLRQMYRLLITFIGICWTREGGGEGAVLLNNFGRDLSQITFIIKLRGETDAENNLLDN